jgi:coenzyme F420-0:L-glutamate ligase/coenzyme F420-1:gamma-L-glutamate ligase
VTSLPQHRISLQALSGLGRIGPGDDLAAMIISVAYGQLSLLPSDVVVIAQKIVSKSENRFVRLSGVTPSARAKQLAETARKDPRLVELILSESRQVLRCVPGLIIVEDRRGLVLANAGIDASNVGPDSADTVLLLPEDPDATAASLAARFSAAAGGPVAVIINDSIGRAWRNGTVGTAIGASGLAACLDLRGTPDLFGRVLQATEIGLADELAAAASVLMGQAAEGRPVVIIRGAPGGGRAGTARDLQRPPAADLFR